MKNYQVHRDGRQPKEFNDLEEAVGYASDTYRWFKGNERIIVVENDPDENGTWKEDRAHLGMRIVAEFHRL